MLPATAVVVFAVIVIVTSVVVIKIWAGVVVVVIWLWPRRLRSGRWAGVWLRRHIVTDQQGKPATAALRAFWGQRECEARLDVRRAGGDGQEQKKVFHFASHRLLSAKCSWRLPSCASNVGLPFLRPMLAT
jgi:hypothetical protein